jgi:putative aldouronate transport system substrate-binding protein
VAFVYNEFVGFVWAFTGDFSMKRLKKLFTVLLASSFVLSVCSCTKSGSSGPGHHKNPDPSKPQYSETFASSPFEPGVTETPNTPAPDSSSITDMTMYINMIGNERYGNNMIQELIAEKTGVRVYEVYLPATSQYEAVHTLIDSGDLPDFIDGSSYNIDLYYAGDLVPWDEYLEKYPNLKALYTDEEWENFRMDDGHIYWANVFERYKDKQYTETIHNDQAFWIQVRVLEWANYPEIKTLDEYFTLLEAYSEANPTMPDGTAVIPYSCISEDWRYFSLELPPMMLDGYPDNRCVSVDTSAGIDNPKVIDYNTTNTAYRYFKKLNEEYKKGIIDPDFGVQTYDEYVSKICSGRVLGLCDAYWDFAYSIIGSYDQQFTADDGSTYSLSSIGCDYVPLGLTIDYGMTQRYHSYGSTIDYTSGIAVTTSCMDPDIAFRFMNDLLSQEIQDLRFWGVEGVDYLVDENGLYYRTDEMINNWNDYSYKAEHCCEYSYFPQWRGMNEDGKNRLMPAEQPSIFLKSVSDPVQKCFNTYGVNNYVEFLGSEVVEPEPWFPLWTWSNYLGTDTHYGTVLYQIGETKHQWLPILVLTSDFDKSWEEYMAAYGKCDPQAFLDAAQIEVDARLNN